MNRLLVNFFIAVLAAFPGTPACSQSEVDLETSAGGLDLWDGLVHPADSATAMARTCPGCPTVPKLLTPVQGKGGCDGTGVRQNDPKVGCSAHPTRGYGFSISFDWTDATSPNGIAGYFIYARNVNAVHPLLDTFVPSSRYVHVRCNTFVALPNLDGWQWRVRAQDRLGKLGPWTPYASFSFEACVLPNGDPCYAHPE